MTHVYLVSIGTFTPPKKKEGLEFKHCLFAAEEKHSPNTYQTETAEPDSNWHETGFLFIPFVTFAKWLACLLSFFFFKFSAVIGPDWSSNQHLNQWFGSCKSSNANLVMCCHACWMWHDSVVRAQMASLRTKRLLSWQGTRWISRHLSILSSSFWFSSLEPWEESITQTIND